MSKQVRLRRGTTVQHASFTGADSELTYDTTLKVLRIHDGATPGGKVLRDALLLNQVATDLQTLVSGGLAIVGADGDGNGLYVSQNAQLEGAVTNVAGQLTVNAAFRRFPSALTYAASVALDFSLSSFRTLALAGNCTFTSLNLLAGASLLVMVTADASLRTLTFPGWKFLGAAAPANIAANKNALLELFSSSTTDALVLARWSVEP